MSALDGWTPVHLGVALGEPYVEWARLEGRRPVEPFFEQTLDAAMTLPFNVALRRRTPLDALEAIAPPDAPPAGFVFHMSHCGSTLVTQMLAALDEHVVLSEPALLSAVAWLHRRVAIDEERQARLLRAAVSALARGVAGTRTFVKWRMGDVLQLPLIRRAFPGVPWTFLCRDPLEVLVAQTRAYGPEILLRELLPQAGAPAAMDDYAAHVLAAVCDAALRQASTGALIVDYDALPDAVFTRMLPHLGVRVDDAQAERMRAATRRSAKAPQHAFRPDGEEKRNAASAHLRTLAATVIDGPYRALLSSAAPAR